MMFFALHRSTYLVELGVRTYSPDDHTKNPQPLAEGFDAFG
jgi:hypothetical protein